MKLVLPSRMGTLAPGVSCRQITRPHNNKTLTLILLLIIKKVRRDSPGACAMGVGDQGASRPS
jgi:hypothetical protein